jgi:four helix bundle protein
MAKTLDELPLYKRAEAFSRAVIAILDRPSVRRNRKLWDQIAEANDSIIANFAEGFEQSTDASFAHFLMHSKASLAEVIARLRQAERRRSLGAQDLAPLEAEATELGKMLGGFIKYLKRCDFKDRGTHKRTL